MELYPDAYYHLYNRSNNNEVVFKSTGNYDFFLNRYRSYFGERLDTIAYCLMPTHFHFLVYIKPFDGKGELDYAQRSEAIKKDIGILLSSYTKAVNKLSGRHGSLFQSHTKARPVEDDSYLSTLVAYIHQNPVRAQLVDRLEDWEYSSYRDYVGLRTDNFLNKEPVLQDFGDSDDFRRFSEQLLISVRDKYWV